MKRLSKKLTWMMAMLISAGVANAAYVTIGGAGNEPDTANGGIYGDVSYEYKISETEVTIAEFRASGIAAGTHWNNGDRTVGPGAPASYISLYQAMQYCNYLTSGRVTEGVYTFVGGEYRSTMSRSEIMEGGLDSIATDPGKIYALPTEDEWYKAAYYDLSGDRYSRYANGSDTIPTEGGDATGWNYNQVRSAPNNARDAAQGSVEQNGTVNMMGNLFEWMEDSAGVVRGSDYTNNEYFLRSLYRLGFAPGNSSAGIGFRTVEIGFSK